MDTELIQKECAYWDDKKRRNSYYFNYGLSTFDDVVKTYNSIPPVRGAKASQDIRPLAGRNLQHKRVVKIDEDTYALTDGYEVSAEFGKDVVLKSYPILWERKSDGEYVTIRSYLNNSHTSVTRYAFVQKYTPLGVNFWYTQQGKHYLNVHGTDYALPKSKVKIHWGNRTATIIQDNKIALKRDGDKFIRVNELLPVPTKRKSELGKSFDPILKSYWKWAETILPVLGDTLDWHAVNEYVSVLSDNTARMWNWHTDMPDPQVFKDIVTNEDDHRRIALAVALAHKADAIQDKRYSPDYKTKGKVFGYLRKCAGLYDIDYK